MNKPIRCSLCRYGQSPCDWCWNDPDGTLNFVPRVDAIDNMLMENKGLREDLARVTAERDAAVERTKALCYLEFCGQCQSDGRPCDGCASKWRGPNEEDGKNDDKEIRQRAAKKMSADDYRSMSVSDIAQIRMDVKRPLKRCDALHAQQEQPNEPLTLDELREMLNTDWVWVVFPELPSEENCWYRAKKLYELFSHEHYGKTWLAYRRKEAGGID